MTTMYTNSASQRTGIRGGYIALMATIIISAILLVMAVEEGSLGWYSRFNILGTEAKEQASALAEGCADQALATIVTDPTYQGDATTTTVGGTCHVFPVQFNTPRTGFVTIKTQAEVRHSYANLQIAMNMSEIHLGTPAPGKGTLVVVTQVINDGSGTSAPSAFTMHVAGTNVSPPTTFAGSDTGVVLTMDAGSYNVTEDTLTGYTKTVSSNCSSSITNGQVKFCTITNDDITTTLTLVANVKNDNAGTNAPADFPLTIDGNAATIGTRYNVTAGMHMVSVTILSGYAASSWGYDCSGSAGSGTVNVGTGQSKTCIISFDDLPPPTPACAETVMMLDRSGSMFGNPAWIPDEKTAAKSLIDLYSGVTPSPKIGVGRFDDVATGLSAEVFSQLSTSYAALKTAIDNGLPQNPPSWTNLSDAITKASDELNSVRHVAGKQKVIILVSDGNPNQPSGATAADTGFVSATSSTQDAPGIFWNNPTGAYASGGEDATSTVSGSTGRERYFTFGFGGGSGLPAGSTISGIEAQINAWNTSSASGAPATSTLAAASAGTYHQWTANTGTDVTAVGTNDADTSYIDTSASIDTFTVANAGVPAGSTINSVTITAVAASATAGAPLQLVAEKGGTLSLDPAPKTLTTSYASYTRTMTTDPTGAAWTLAEVNAWTTHFGVRTTNAAATPKVTQFYVTVNYSSGADSGYRAPTAAVAPNSWTNPTRAFANDALYATDATNGHQQGYSFGAAGLAIPAGATITGVEVAVTAKSSSVSGFFCSLAIGTELSSNGATYTSTGNNSAISTTEATNIIGGPGNLWGRVWTAADFNSGSFLLRVQNSISGFFCSGTSNLNQAQLRVYYTSGSASTPALTPVAVGTYSQWTPNTGTGMTAVGTNDADTSYIDTSASIDTFTVVGAGVPAGSTISSVTMTAIARSVVAGAQMQLVVDNGGAPNIGPVTTLTTAYATYTRVMTTNPLTGAAWTLAEVNAWTARFGVRTTNAAATPRVTQFSVSVSYTPPPPIATCQLGMDLSWNGGTTWTTEKVQTLTGTASTYTLGSAADDWSNSHIWTPADFSNANFRARVHAINPGAGCSASAVDHLDWLQLKVHYAQNVDPVQAALNAADAAKLAGVSLFTIYFGSGNPTLLAQLASGSVANPPHQPGSFAQAGGLVSGDTGYVAPTSAAAPNQWTNPTRAFVSDNSYATDAVNGHQQGYTTFGFNIPPTATITGIALSVEAKSSDTSGCQIGGELSSNNGASFTNNGATAGLSGSDVLYTLGGANSLWGRSWAPSDFNNGSFVVRLQDIDPGNACTNGSTLSTDQIRARVYYTVNTENSDGDNFFIAPTSADMQGIFNFIGSQVCPASLNLGSPPPPTTGTLLVMTQVTNNNGGSKVASDFTATVSATNPTPASFPGSSSGVSVAVGPGSYSVTEAPVAGYNEIPGATCSSNSAGNIAAGETRVCVLTNDDIPPPPPPPNFNINVGTWQEVP